MLREFRAFMLRGSIIELAVAIVIGAAFGALVTSQRRMGIEKPQDGRSDEATLREEIRDIRKEQRA